MKIGVADRPSRRLADMQVGCPHPLSLVKTILFPNRMKARNAENGLHLRFSSVHARGEWFRLNDELDALLCGTSPKKECGQRFDVMAQVEQFVRDLQRSDVEAFIEKSVVPAKAARP